MSLQKIFHPGVVSVFPVFLSREAADKAIGRTSFYQQFSETLMGYTPFEPPVSPQRFVAYFRGNIYLFTIKQFTTNITVPCYDLLDYDTVQSDRYKIVT